MARTLAELPSGSRITDYISLGVIAKFFPVEKIHDVLEQTNRASVRERDLPAHVVVYYVIALALYMRSSYREVLRCLLEGVQWLLDPSAKVKVAGKSGISQARTRLGAAPLKNLYGAVVVPSRRSAPRAPGTGGGDWSAWMAARWMSPTRPKTRRPSGVQAPVEVRVLSPRSGSWRCWRMERTCCGARTWTNTPPMNSLWPGK
jgi:hypothetical protein